MNLWPGGESHIADMNMQGHKERLKRVRATVDTSLPVSVRQFLPKRFESNDEKGRIARDNQVLAQKLFGIMDKPSLVAVSIRRDHQVESHPGTLNFKARLDEAQRINQMNVLIAQRLETVKPCYIKKDVITTFPLKTKTKIDSNAEHSPRLRVLNIGESINLNANQGHSNHRAVGTNSSVERLNRNAVLTNKAMNSNKQTKPPTKQKQRPRVPKILLEYIKIQMGQTIDTVVMKEPFKDRYAVFGIDVTSGQRFELHFSSEEVFNVLEGDMLVTSVEDKAVWTALLEKVELLPVQKFTKFLPSLIVHEAQEKSIFPVANHDRHFDSFDHHTEELLLDGHKKVIASSEVQEMSSNERDKGNYASDDVLIDQERYNSNDSRVDGSHTEVLCIHSQSSDLDNEDQLDIKNQLQQQQQQQQQQTSQQQPQHNEKERKRQSVPSYMRSRKSAVDNDIKPEPSNGIIPPGQRVRQGEAMSRLAVPPKRPPPVSGPSRTIRTKKQSSHDVTTNANKQPSCDIPNTIEDAGDIVADEMRIESDEVGKHSELDSILDEKISNTSIDDIEIEESPKIITASSSSQLAPSVDDYEKPPDTIPSEQEDTTDQLSEHKAIKIRQQPKPPVTVKTTRILQGRKYRGNVVERKDQKKKLKGSGDANKSIKEVSNEDHSKNFIGKKGISIASESKLDENHGSSPDLTAREDKGVTHKSVPDDDSSTAESCHIDSDAQAKSINNDIDAISFKSEKAIEDAQDLCGDDHVSLESKREYTHHGDGGTSTDSL